MCVCERVCVHASGGRILTIVEKVAHDKALVPVRLHLVSVPISHCDVEFTTVIVMNENAWCLRGSTSVFVLISPCAAEFTTVKVMNENALVPVRLHISFRTDNTHCAAEFTTVKVMNETALVPAWLHISFRTYMGAIWGPYGGHMGVIWGYC